MNRLFLAVIMLSGFVSSSWCQQTKLWTDQERKYLVANLSRTRQLVIEETKNLTPAQWNFKESADKWSINQIVEHLGIWELLLDREINLALAGGPKPELTKEVRTDSSVVTFLMEEKQHIAPEYTRPFTFTVPLGLNEGKHNLAWFLKMRDEAIGFTDSTTTDLRYYFLRPGRKDVHQVFVTIFAHTDRHLRQIRKVKLSANYPRHSVAINR
jgi:hypothetical protein